jgi:hypothetical protein
VCDRGGGRDASEEVVIHELRPISDRRRSRPRACLAVRELLCAVVEQSVKDVRAARRRGTITKDLRVKDWVTTRRFKNKGNLHDATIAELQELMHFFKKGHLARLLALIDSRDLHAERIIAELTK